MFFRIWDNQAYLCKIFEGKLILNHNWMTQV